MDTTGSRSGMNRRGQALAEYAALVAIVGVALVVILGLFGQATKKTWDRSASSFADDPPAIGYSGGGSSSSGGGASGVRYTPPAAAPGQGSDGSGKEAAASDSTGAESADSAGSRHAAR